MNNCGCYNCSKALNSKQCFISEDGKYLCDKCSVGIKPIDRFFKAKLDINSYLYNKFSTSETRTTWIEQLHSDKFIHYTNSVVYDFYYNDNHYNIEYFYNLREIEFSQCNY